MQDISLNCYLFIVTVIIVAVVVDHALWLSVSDTIEIARASIVDNCVRRTQPAVMTMQNTDCVVR